MDLMTVHGLDVLKVRKKEHLKVFQLAFEILMVWLVTC